MTAFSITQHALDEWTQDTNPKALFIILSYDPIGANEAARRRYVITNLLERGAYFDNETNIRNILRALCHESDPIVKQLFLDKWNYLVQNGLDVHDVDGNGAKNVLFTERYHPEYIANALDWGAYPFSKHLGKTPRKSIEEEIQQITSTFGSQRKLDALNESREILLAAEHRIIEANEDFLRRRDLAFRIGLASPAADVDAPPHFPIDIRHRFVSMGVPHLSHFRHGPLQRRQAEDQ